MDYKRLGKKIREERIKNKMTQAHLAEISGISNNFLGQIERAEKIPSLETIVNISQSLNVTINSLMYDIPENDNIIVSELLLALSKLENKDKLLLLDIIRCFSNMNNSEKS